MNQQFDHLPDTSPPKAWTSIWLRKLTLASFAILFLLLFIALQIIYYVSERDNGFATSDERRHYLWTYGPTGVLTIIVACWRQVDFHSKQIIPWAELAKGPAPAKKTLSLNYVALIDFSAIIEGIRNKHMLVVLTTLCGILLQLTVVFSTGLFVLKEINMAKETDLVTLNRFDASSYDIGLVDSHPLYNALGIQLENLPCPPGIIKQNSSQFAIQQIQPVTGSTDMTAQVNAFFTDMDCETGKLWANVSDVRGNLQISIDYPSGCTINTTSKSYGSSYGEQSVVDSSKGYFGQMQQVSCTNETDYRILVVFIYWISSANFNDFNTIPEAQFPNISNVLCKPKYGIMPNATYVANDNKLIASNMSNTLVGLSQSEFGAGVVKAFITSSGLDDFGPFNPAIASPRSTNEVPGQIYDDTYIRVDDFFSLIGVMVPKPSINDYFDSTVLEKGVKAAFNVVGMQVANSYLTQPWTSSFSNKTSGTVTFTYNRLVVHSLSLVSMQILLLLLAIFATIVCQIAPRGVVPRNPVSLGALATIFASNDIDIFFGTGDKDKKLTGQFKSRVNEGSFIIEEDSRELCISKGKWWKPLITCTPFKLVTILTPIVLIVGLEILYQETTHGMSIKGGRYVYAYVPAVVMSSMAIPYVSLYSTVRTIQPYRALSRGTSDLLDQPLGKIFPKVAYDAVRKHHWIILIGAIGAMLSSLLTILVSGLYTPTTNKFSNEISLRQLDRFTEYSEMMNRDTDWVTPKVVASLIIESNLSDPYGTFSEYVFPRMELDDHLSQFYFENTVVRVTVPTLHYRTNCTVVPNDRLNVTIKYANPGYNLIMSTLISETWVELPQKIDRQPFSSATDGYFGDRYETADGEQNSGLWIVYGQSKRMTLLNITTLHCLPYVEQIDASLQLMVPSLNVDPTYPPQVLQASAKEYAQQAESFFFGVNPVFQNMTTNDNNTFSDLFNAIVYGKDGTPPEELLNTTTLINAAQRVVGILGAQNININYRKNIGLNATDTSYRVANTTYPVVIYTGEISLSRFRLKQNLLSTRFLQAVLAVMCLCACLTYAQLRDTNHLLVEEPGSIAAAASLLAGSSLLSRDIIPKGFEWNQDKDLFRGVECSLGWWHTNGKSWYGIDIGKAGKAE